MELVGQLNWVDWILLAWIGVGLASAWARGFLAVALDLLGMVLSVWAALRWYSPLGGWLEGRWGLNSTIAPALAFLALWLGTGLLVMLLGGALLARVPEAAHRSLPNRLLALFPGAINSLILAAILVTLLVVLPWGSGIEASVRASKLGSQLLAATTEAEAALRPVLDDALGELLTFRAIRPDSDERVDLPFTVASPEASAEAEAEMLRLLNAARTDAGLDPLVADESLRAVARAHATDMFQRGYFAHLSPEGTDPFDRIRAANITFLAAGENLALAPTVQVAHAGLMRSPGHRANILETRFHRVGIGAMDGGLRGIMFVQLFRD